MLPEITDASLASVAWHCRSLTSLCLSHCPGITDRGIAQAAPHLHRLQHLYISCCHNITDRWAACNSTVIVFVAALPAKKKNHLLHLLTLKLLQIIVPTGAALWPPANTRHLKMPKHLNNNSGLPSVTVALFGKSALQIYRWGWSNPGARVTSPLGWSTLQTKEFN